MYQNVKSGDVYKCRSLSFWAESGGTSNSSFLGLICDLGQGQKSKFFVLQEIPLSEILQVELAQDFCNQQPGSNPHCFEVITASMVYYVGEDNGGLHHNPVLAASGVGRDVGQSWEKAVRQAMMPVTPKSSVITVPGQGKDHSESLPETTQYSLWHKNI